MAYKKMAYKKVGIEQPDLFAADVGGSQPSVPSLRPWHLPYNGWTWAERCAVTPIQNAMFRSGELIRPTVCSICDFSRPDQINGSGYIYSHLERYDRPAEIYPACKPCHAALHARFRDPQRWLRLCERNRRPEAWFLALTLDPATQWLPFGETYPKGLPPPPTLGSGLFVHE